jgi:hypothetical protein
VAERKPFLIRVDRDVLAAVQRWADDDLRSLNAQIEFVLRRALQAEGRLKPAPRSRGGGEDPGAGDRGEDPGS